MMYPTRVDARVLAPGTTPRFLLLIALITASAISTLATMVPEQSVEGTSRWALCTLASGGDPGPTINVSTVTTYRPDVYAACMSSYRATVVTWTLAACGLMLALTLAIYWLLPAWKRRPPAAVEARGVP